MTRGLHDISKALKADLELKDSPDIFLSKKVNLVYSVNSVPALKELEYITPIAAVQNTWYTAFEGVNCEFSSLGVVVTVADETVEMRITIDGVVFTPVAGIALAFAGNNTSSIYYSRLYAPSTENLVMEAGATYVQSSTHTVAWLRGHNVKIEVRKTTVAGASFLRVLGLYHQY